MPTARSNHPAALLAALLAMLIVTAAVARTSQAAFTATSGSDAGWGSGTVTITDNDSGVALFDSATNGMLDGGSTVQRCIQATYTGDITANVHIRLHATASGRSPRTWTPSSPKAPAEPQQSAPASPPTAPCSPAPWPP